MSLASRGSASKHPWSFIPCRYGFPKIIRLLHVYFFVCCMQRGLLENEKVHLPRGSAMQQVSSFKDGNSEVLDLPPSTGRKRRLLTMESASKIHGNSSLSPSKKRKVSLRGLFNTVVTHATTKELKEMSKGSTKINEKVVPSLTNVAVRAFEKSADNVNRSVMILYRGGLMSKAKYNSVLSSLMYKTGVDSKKKRCKLSNGVLLPKLPPYKDLMKFIKSIDIGVLKPIPQAEQIENQDSPNVTQQVSGCFLDLEARLLQLADLYLSIDKVTPILSWFGKAPGTFLVAIGADGAPFGKDNEATSWLVSFLNLGNRIASCDDNFLLLGANCKEDHPAMIKYATQIRGEIALIESKTYQLQGHDIAINFKFELVPSDMKWLATFSGELTNSATYPSSFANVKQDDVKNVHGTFGIDSTCTWKPWSYDQRVKVAKLVDKYKQTTVVNKPLKQQRNLVTKFIASKHSRQEFEPVLGPVVHKAKCEPLHLGNNCWQVWNKEVMTIALTRTNPDASIVTVYQLPFECCFRKYLRAVRNKVKSHKLYKKIVKWFREKRKEKSFECRFTGEETRKFCSNFMDVIEAVISPNDTEGRNARLYALAFSGLRLRNACSLMNRVTDINQKGIDDLQKSCQEYFICSSLFSTSVTLSMWTVGLCAPYHSRSLFSAFQVGLGINTMQGREAKHQKLATYAEFSLPKERWEKVFLHEHMSLIWLRQQNPHLVKYSKSKLQYIPKRCYTREFCFCGLPKRQDETGCKYCQSPLMAEISACVAARKITIRMRHILE